jgi:hypothetical protein
MDEILVIVGMFLLRLGLPLAITVVVGYALRRLDAKWETEALTQQQAEELPAAVQKLKPADPPCWERKGCSEERRAHCPARELWYIPCWAAQLRVTGQLPAACHDCELFSLSPA